MVEDDAVSVEVVKQYLSEFNYTTTLEVADSLQMARSLLNKNDYNLVLLDIHLDDGKSTEIVNIIDTDIVFITSDPRYALDAFEYNAIDYLLKPVSKERFVNTIRKIESKQVKKNDFIVLRADYVYHKVLFSDILYVKSNGDYLSVFLTNGNTLTFHGRMKNFIERLDSEFFKRCHNSFIININHIEQSNTTSLIINSTEIPISKRYKNEILSSIVG